MKRKKIEFFFYKTGLAPYKLVWSRESVKKNEKKILKTLSLFCYRRKTIISYNMPNYLRKVEFWMIYTNISTLPNVYTVNSYKYLGAVFDIDVTTLCIYIIFLLIEFSLIKLFLLLFCPFWQRKFQKYRVLLRYEIQIQ